MRVLLSIKPEFVEAIFAGDKTYEYRKSVFKEPGVRTVVVYATRPVAKIVGEFEVGEVLSGAPEEVWQRTHCQGGISREFFDDYFKDRKRAFAIAIIGATLYDEPIDPEALFSPFSAPQSYKYLHATEPEQPELL